MLRLRISAVLAILGVAFAVSGCGMTRFGNTLGETIPHWAGGEPAGAPARTATQVPYPAVHDMPPARSTKLISVSEQTKLESELATLRSQVANEAATLQQQHQTEEAASKELAARASAVQSKAARLRQQDQTDENARKKLEAVVRGRAEAAHAGRRPQTTAQDPSGD